MKKYTYNEIIKIFTDTGYQLISTEYIFGKCLEYICPNNHKGKIGLSQFIYGRRCRLCYNMIRGNKQKISFDDIKKEFQKYGFNLITTEYIDSKTHLEYICDNGHKSIRTYDHFKRSESKCVKCSRINKSLNKKIERFATSILLKLGN